MRNGIIDILCGIDTALGRRQGTVRADFGLWSESGRFFCTTTTDRYELEDQKPKLISQSGFLH